MNNLGNNNGETPDKSEASKRIEETPNLLSYEVFRFGDPRDNVDISELPKDMSDPECWEKIAQVCMGNNVSIICYLDKPYKDCSTVVFKSSGKYLLIGQGVEDDAFDAFVTSDEVLTFSANVFGHARRFYYIWDDYGCGHILFNGDEDDTTENRVTLSESFGLYTSMLLKMPDLELF